MADGSYRFRFGDTIGTGGFGVVREATLLDENGNEVPGERYAVKELKPEWLQDDEALHRFKREVRLLGELDHPHVITVVARNLSDSPPWFVMPRAPGSLKDELRNGRSGDVGWVTVEFRKVIQAISYAHGKGILHRDLKPQNVLFVDGQPRVSDFGLGKELGSASTEVTQSHQAMGTLPYMAPEQFDDMKRVDKQADVYALGKILCEMLDGSIPPAMRLNLTDIPPEFHYFINRCCADDPDDRYPDGSEALAAFDVLTASPTGLVDPPLEAAENLVQEWTRATGTAKPDVLRRLDEHLRQNGAEEELFFQVVPRLPPELVEQYVAERPQAFHSTLALYNDHIRGGLPFDYCDLVANFYSRVWEVDPDVSARRLMLARLITMGASHNRFYVGGVVARLLASIDDASTAMMAADVVRADPHNARWFQPYVESVRLARPIAEAFDSFKQQPSPATDDIPF
jgi:eukaryotic-like serine/threonine-protein kinase